MCANAFVRKGPLWHVSMLKSSPHNDLATCWPSVAGGARVTEEVARNMSQFPK